MHGTFWSLLPFIVVVPLALWTRQVLPGLLVGLLLGAYMLSPTPFGGIDTALRYVMKELVIPDNLRLLVFMYGFGAFVGLVRITGGVSGFAEAMEARIHTGRGAFIVTWFSALITFMAPDFRIITVGPVMKQVFSKLGVPVSKVAFVIDSTATPLCAIMPLGTVFIGYALGLLGSVSRHQGIAASPYHLFLLSIPFNFFSLAMLLFALYYTFRMAGGKNAPEHVSQPVESTAKLRALGSSKLAYAETSMELGLPMPLSKRKQGNKDKDNISGDKPGVGKSGTVTYAGKKDSYQKDSYQKDSYQKDSYQKDSYQKDSYQKDSETYPDPVELAAQHVPPNALNLIVPLALLLGLTLFYTWRDGHLHTSSFLGAFIQANAAQAMLEALLSTLLLSFIWYASQRHSIKQILFGFLQGGNEMMAVNVLLVLVWALSAVSTDLGFVSYVQAGAGRLVPPAFIAPAFFVFGCVLSYVIGSTFGTWGILLPLGFSLAASEHAALPLIAGAVFASGTFGGYVSPLSDNTVAMATVMKLSVMDYAKLKLRYGVVVAAFCTLLYGVAGWLYH